MSSIQRDKWLAVFDMDGTLLPGTTSAQEISRVAGVHEEICELERLYLLDGIDSISFSVAALKLWEAGGDDVFRRAWETAPKLENIDRTLDVLHQNGAVTCLITMAHREFAEQFSNFNYVFSSEYGHKIVNPCDKPLIATKLANRYGIVSTRIAAFGDSHSDIPLFEKVEHSVAINASNEIRALAKHCYTGLDVKEAAALVFPDWFKGI